MSTKSSAKIQKESYHLPDPLTVESGVFKGTSFAISLIAWYREFGRHELPWHGSKDPYRRWISEIMLQQTRVATVIPYYQRFIDRFPDVFALEAANLDAVLECWAGLGYYARARYLHQAASTIVRDYSGVFPRTFDEIIQLPGIGRSSAGAILAFAFDKKYPILDANVRRILCRYHVIEGWSGESQTSRNLWNLADYHTPSQDISEYTQAIMDLGASVCFRRRPNCERCPISTGCQAYLRNEVELYPTSRPRKVRATREVRMVMVRDACGRILLEHRASSGLWGGLWGFPECPSDQSPEDWCRKNLDLEVECAPPWPMREHVLTHLNLKILPLPARLLAPTTPMNRNDWIWYKLGTPFRRGVAAPIRQLLEMLRDYPL